MNRSTPQIRAALATTGLALALFQCWYVYLPADEAIRFSQCRLNAHLDCFKSLSTYGADMMPFGLPVFPALAGLYLWMAALLGFAATADEPRRSGWIAWAGVLAFPVTGLSAYVLLNDLMVAKATSLSTLLLLGHGVALFLMAVLGGLPAPALRAGARGAGAFSLIGLLAASLLYGGGSTRLAAREVEIERESAPAQLRWSRFLHTVPRVGAAHLGNATAAREVLLFVDPKQPESQALMRAANALAGALGQETAIYLYAPDDPRLLQAFRDGKLSEFLDNPQPFPKTDAPEGFARQQAAIRKIDIGGLPTARWRGGSASGAIDLTEILRELR